MNTSDIKSSAFRTHFRAKSEKNIKSFVPLLILQMLGFPLLTATSMYFSQYSGKPGPDLSTAGASLNRSLVIFYTVFFISAMSVIASLFIGISIAVSNFRYLHRKAETDMVFSLPITRKQLFAADYLSGLAAFLIPGIIAALTAITILWFTPNHCIYIPDYDAAEISGYLTSASIESGILCNLPSQQFYSVMEFTDAARLIAEFIPAMFMLYTFTVFVMVCCGTFFEAVLYFFGLTAVTSVFPSLLYTYGEYSIPYTNGNFYPFTLTELICPAGGLLRLLINLTNLFDRDFLSDADNIPSDWGIKYTLITAALLILTLVIFINRKAEKTSVPFAWTGIFYITSFCITASVLTAAVLSNRLIPSVLMVSLIICSVIFLIMLIIKDRSPKIKKPVNQAVFLLGSFFLTVAFLLTCRETGCFGRMNYIPSPENVLRVEIEDYRCSGNSWTVSGYDSVKAVTEAHELINADMYSRGYNVMTCPEYYYSDLFTNRKYNISAMCDATPNLSVTYYLKNGTAIGRRLLPLNADYTDSPLYFVSECRWDTVNNNERAYDAILNAEMLFCGTTEYAEQFCKDRLLYFTTSENIYPPEYRISDYDEVIFRELLEHAYYGRYYSPDDCFVLRSSDDIQLFIPKEYSDIYEKFLNSGTLEELEWEQ